MSTADFSKNGNGRGWKTVLAQGTVRWLFGQEAVVVVLVLILVVQIVANAMVYRDGRAERREWRAAAAKTLEKFEAMLTAQRDDCGRQQEQDRRAMQAVENELNHLTRAVERLPARND